MSVALRGTDLPMERIRERFAEFGFDESTLLTDLDLAMMRFQLALASELRAAAEAAQAPLFNRVTLARLDSMLERLTRFEQADAAPSKPKVRPHGVPQSSSHFVGRDADMRELRTRLGASGLQVLTAVHGWPGVGKTTVASHLANDRAFIEDVFPDGVLWASVGEVSRIAVELASWARQLRLPDLGPATPVEQLTRELTTALQERRMLVVVDDLWDAAHAVPFLVGGARCATLVTTRLPEIAAALTATRNDNIYRLGILSEEAALELLSLLAPEVVPAYPAESLALVRALECLPLAIWVAGRLLHRDATNDWNVGDLLDELAEGSALLAERAPLDRAEPDHTIPTVAALLRKSTDHLDEESRLRFAYLGAFAPKPATFELEDMAEVWETTSPKHTVHQLVDRGLLEPVGSGRFHMHAILVFHANALLTELA
ncbi:NB-ARC domain-containing protein [Lentzea sp. NPDC051213]|uniref:NB-ARC domain-containing protein n=1 Tax=Lentzea sp. NPDC051213 TaxID=3364126 RepID=UPI00379A5208